MQLVPPNCFKCSWQLLVHACPGIPARWTVKVGCKGVIVCDSGRLACWDCCREQGSAKAFKIIYLPPCPDMFSLEEKEKGDIRSKLDKSKGQWTPVHVQINSVQQGTLQKQKVNFCKIPEAKQSTSLSKFTVNRANHHRSAQ
jgi:hypothetical protein